MNFLIFRFFWNFSEIFMNLFIFKRIEKILFIYRNDAAACSCGSVCMHHIAHVCVYKNGLSIIF